MSLTKRLSGLCEQLPRSKRDALQSWHRLNQRTIRTHVLFVTSLSPASRLCAAVLRCKREVL